MRTWTVVAALAVGCGDGAEEPIGLVAGEYEITWGDAEGGCPDRVDGIVTPYFVEITGGPDAYTLTFTSGSDPFTYDCTLQGRRLGCDGEYALETFVGDAYAVIEDATFTWTTTYDSGRVDRTGGLAFALYTEVVCDGASCDRAIEAGGPPAPCDALTHAVAKPL